MSDMNDSMHLKQFQSHGEFPLAKHENRSQHIPQMLCVGKHTVGVPAFFLSMITLLCAVHHLLKQLKLLPSYSDKGFVMITAVISVLGTGGQPTQQSCTSHCAQSPTCGGHTAHSRGSCTSTATTQSLWKREASVRKGRVKATCEPGSRSAVKAEQAGSAALMKRTGGEE